jgi:alkylation response protein AidB-like acyl-CoA dehydrogenase
MTASEQFRRKVRAFLAANLPPGWAGIGALSQDVGEQFLAAWRRTLADNGLIAITWPVEYGGQGLSQLEQVVLAEEFARSGVPVGIPNDTFGIKMVGNTLLKWGTEQQKQHFLPRIVAGEYIWCQGYSEPDAGSDLASLSCRAVLDGDEWVIDGQKIWTSNAHLANWIFVLVRTDPTAPKHKGISFLLVPLDQPGIELRPIRMLSGLREFNETFFTAARTAAANVVGPVNGGWGVAMTLLGHERGEEAATNPVVFRMEFERLVELARTTGRVDDAVIRQRLADCYARVEIMRFLGQRILAGYLRQGSLGPEASIAKLYWSEYHRLVTALAVDIVGADALTPAGRPAPRAFRADDPGAPNSSASWVGAFYNSIAGTIYAGTSQIQRNILGETVLGLPREPIADRP